MAVNCRRLSPSASPCAQCENCTAVLRDEALFYREYNGSDHDDAEFARDMLRQASHNAYPAKVRVLFYDEVQGLQQKSSDILLKALEAVPDEAGFIFATSEPQNVRTTLKDRCVRATTRLITPAEGLTWLSSICAAEDITFDRSALEAIVDLAEGKPRNLLGHLEDACRDNHVSIHNVERYCELGWTKELIAYWQAAMLGDFPRQLDAITQWNATPTQKRLAVRKFAQHLFHEFVAPQRVEVPLEAAFRFIPNQTKQSIANLWKGASHRLGRDLVSFGLDVTTFWTNATSPDDDASALLNHLTRFHHLLHPGDQGAPLPMPTPEPTNVEEISRPSRQRSTQKKSSALKNAPDGAFLSLAHAEAIYNASSFLVQEHGKCFNARLELNAQELGLSAPDKAVEFEQDLLHRLSLRLKDWSGDRRSVLHYVLTHEVNDDAFVTRIVMHIPREPEDLRAAVHEFVQRALPRHSSPLVPTFPDQRWRAPVVADFALHISLVRELWRSLDPGRTHWNASRKREPLIDLLGVSSIKRRTAGKLVGRTRRVSSSDSLGRAAKAAATAKRMGLLSAFVDAAWSRIGDGWELAEHAHRTRTREERTGQIARITAAFPPGVSDWQDRTREIEIQSAEEAWPIDPKLRPRSWNVWW